MNGKNQEFFNVECLGFQISADGQRVWVCIDGQCVLRAKGIELLEFRDDRISEADKTISVKSAAS